MIVLIVLGFYFAVCVGVLLFNIWYVLSGRFVQWQIARQKQYYYSRILKEIKQYDQNSPEKQDEMIAELSGTLRHIYRLMAFHLAVDELEKENPERMKKYMPIMAKLVQRVFRYYRRKSDTGQAYYSFLLTRFEVMQYAPSEAITAFLIEQIRGKKSLYNLENALRAIYSSGQVSLMLDALELLSSAGEGRIHEKLLVDGMMTFPYPDKLIAALWNSFSSYNEEMQKILLNYIRFASGNWGTEMLKLLQSTDKVENKIACIRYFAKYPEERFRKILYRIAEESGETQWELCAVCMNALASYSGSETVKLLKNMLSSQNWYVRYNAAFSLRKLNVPQAELQDVLEGNDRYAKEMLRYRFSITK